MVLVTYKNLKFILQDTRLLKSSIDLKFKNKLYGNKGLGLYSFLTLLCCRECK